MVVDIFHRSGSNESMFTGSTPMPRGGSRRGETLDGRYAPATPSPAFAEPCFEGMETRLLLDVTAPTIAQTIVQDGQAQRTQIDNLAVVFSEAVNAQALIDNGTMANAVRLCNLTTGQDVVLTTAEFSYDAATFTLTWTSTNGYLAPGEYALVLSSRYITDLSGNALTGPGTDSGLPVFTAATMIQAGGVDLQVPSYSVPALGGESILVALERAGLNPPSRCRSGECGYCRSFMKAGSVYIPPEEEMRKQADRDTGHIHPCCSFPLEDIELDMPRAK